MLQIQNAFVSDPNINQKLAFSRISVKFFNYRVNLANLNISQKKFLQIGIFTGHTSATSLDSCQMAIQFKLASLS